MPDLEPNFGLCIGRLKATLSQLKNYTPGTLEKYDLVIKDFLSKGMIEVIDQDQLDGKIVHYLPHHAILTPEKTTTKIRPVFGGSARTRKGNKSLNECLYRGPVLLPELCGMLLRFRKYKIVVISDVEKAFLQIGLAIEDRDATRFYG